jgi:hypothetical protein
MMTAEELSDAATKLAYGLGIRVYIRDGRIYQHGPGIEFLPPKGHDPTPEFDEDFFTLTDELVIE